MVKCSLLKELTLTAEEMLRLKAMREKVTRHDAVQQIAIGSLQSTLKYYKDLKNRVDEKHEAGRKSSSG